MKKQIRSVSVLQTSKVMAVLYLVISLPIILLSVIPFLLAGRGSGPYGVGFLLLMPLLYALFGFIFTAICAWVYNMVASAIGGVEFTTVEVGGSD